MKISVDVIHTVNDKVGRFRFFTIAYVLLIYKIFEMNIYLAGGWVHLELTDTLFKIKLCYLHGQIFWVGG